MFVLLESCFWFSKKPTFQAHKKYLVTGAVSFFFLLLLLFFAWTEALTPE